MPSIVEASLLQPFAAAHIDDRDHKERQRCCDEYQVLHRFHLPSSSRSTQQSVRGATGRTCRAVMSAPVILAVSDR